MHTFEGVHEDLTVHSLLNRQPVELSLYRRYVFSTLSARDDVGCHVLHPLQIAQ
jgi:hypothetical protein